MKNINLTITKENIQKYMKENVSLVQHKEPLFVDYMKKSKGTTLEGLEILFKNYYEEISLTKLDYRRNEVLMHLLTFEDYLKNRTFDANALFHILIPIRKLEGGFYLNHSELVYTSHRIVDEMLRENRNFRIDDTSIWDVIDNYEVAGQIEEGTGYCQGYSKVLMDYKKCELELETYKMIYGTKNVQKILKLVKERVW